MRTIRSASLTLFVCVIALSGASAASKQKNKSAASAPAKADPKAAERARQAATAEIAGLLAREHAEVSSIRGNRTLSKAEKHTAIHKIRTGYLHKRQDAQARYRKALAPADAAPARSVQ